MAAPPAAVSRSAPSRKGGEGPAGGPADGARRTWLAVGALAALAAALRFPTLGIQSVWVDESLTVLLARDSFGGIVDGVVNTESNPPLYYLLVWLWGKVLGTEPAAIRSLSAVCGTALVPVAFLIGRQISGLRAGVIAAGLVATSPILVWYSQEARAYALVILMTAVAALFLIRALDRPDSRRDLWLWALFAGLSFLSHYYSVFAIAPQAIALLLWHRRRPQAVRAVAAAAGAGAVLLPLFVHQLESDGARHYIRATELDTRIRMVPKNFLIGFDNYAETLAGAAMLALLAFAVYLLARRATRRERRRAAAFGALGLVTGGAILFATFLGVDFLITRNVLVAWIPLGVAAAAGFAASRAGRAGVMAGGAACAIGLALVVGVAVGPQFQRDDWRHIAEELGPPPDVHRAVLLSNGMGLAPIDVYRQGLEPYPKEGALVQEIVLAATTVRGTGLDPAPPRTHPAPLPGFREVKRVEGESFTVVVMRGPNAVGIPRPVLETLRLGAGSYVTLDPMRAPAR